MRRSPRRTVRFNRKISTVAPRTTRSARSLPRAHPAAARSRSGPSPCGVWPESTVIHQEAASGQGLSTSRPTRNNIVTITPINGSSHRHRIGHHPAHQPNDVSRSLMPHPNWIRWQMRKRPPSASSSVCVPASPAGLPAARQPGPDRRTVKAGARSPRCVRRASSVESPPAVTAPSAHPTRSSARPGQDRACFNSARAIARPLALPPPTRLLRARRSRVRNPSGSAAIELSALALPAAARSPPARLPAGRSAMCPPRTSSRRKGS